MKTPTVISGGKNLHAVGRDDSAYAPCIQLIHVNSRKSQTDLLLEAVDYAAGWADDWDEDEDDQVHVLYIPTGDYPDSGFGTNRLHAIRKWSKATFTPIPYNFHLCIPDNNSRLRLDDDDSVSAYIRAIEQIKPDKVYIELLGNTIGLYPNEEEGRAIVHRLWKMANKTNVLNVGSNRDSDLDPIIDLLDVFRKPQPPTLPEDGDPS